METMDQMKEKTPFNKWYAKNKKAFNAKRRERYKKDKAYRQKQIEQAKNYNETHRPRKDADIVVDGVKQHVYKINEVASQIGMSVWQVRSWHVDGFVPECTIEAPYRLYTKRQVALLKRMAKALKKVEDAGYKEQRAVKEKVGKQVSKQW